VTDGLSEAYDEKKWDVFCENNELLLENDQLKARNADLCDQLQEANACADEMAELYGERIARLEDDRDKLRKLVRDMFRDFVNADCELKLNTSRTFIPVRYVTRMREAGVEVDG